MMTGLRLGIGRAIIGMVAAEFFTAITGLGALIVKYGNQYDTASMFVPIFDADAARRGAHKLGAPLGRDVCPVASH